MDESTWRLHTLLKIELLFFFNEKGGIIYFYARARANEIKLNEKKVHFKIKLYSKVLKQENLVSHWKSQNRDKRNDHLATIL